MMKVRSVRSALLLFCGLLLAPYLAVRADPIIVGYPTDNGVSIFPVCAQCAVPSGLSLEAAAQFTLLGSFNVTTIDLTLGVISPGTYDFSLQDSLTGSPTVFFSETVTTTGGSFPTFEAHSLTVNLHLGPGTYYLVDSTTDLSASGGWAVSDGTLVSNGGTAPNGAWASRDSGATWAFLTDAVPPCTVDLPCNSPTFAVHGTPATTTAPEPATLALLGLCLAGLGFSRRSTMIAQRGRT